MKNLFIAALMSLLTVNAADAQTFKFDNSDALNFNFEGSFVSGGSFYLEGGFNTENRFESGERVGFNFGTQPGLDDIASSQFSNPFNSSFNIGGAIFPTGIILPDVDVFYVTVFEAFGTFSPFERLDVVLQEPGLEERSQAFRGVRISTVPEPATWLMMILGFGMTGFALKRRRRALA